MLVLWVVAAFGVLSVFWTVGFEAATVRGSAVTAGFAAVAVAAAVQAGRPRGPALVAGLICVLAAVSAGIGLVAAALHDPPFADRIGGAWRPGGVLEYSSANALLQVSALPALLAGACNARRSLSLASVAGAALAAMTIALAQSRLEIVLAAAVCAIAIAASRATLDCSRGEALLLVALAGAAAICAEVVAGGYTPIGDDGGGEIRVAILAALVFGAPAAWGLLRPVAGRVSPARLAPIGVASAAGLAAAALLIQADRESPPQSGYSIEGQGGVLHNRAGLWDAALETWADHRVRGSGANSFLTASARHQDGATVRFAHSIPLEWLAELGAIGGLLALLLYGSCAEAILRARGSPALWLFGPAVGAFMIAGLFDWPWHLAGSGAVWALALGALVASAPLSRHETD